MGGGKTVSDHQKHELTRIVPHPRTLRKAREQVKQMVLDGTSSRRIRRYLNRFCAWWVNASDTWHYQEFLQWFLEVCWDKSAAEYATALSQLQFNKLHTEISRAGVAA